MTALHKLHLTVLALSCVRGTGPTDFAPLEQLQKMRFKGESWQCSDR